MEATLEVSVSDFEDHIVEFFNADEAEDSEEQIEGLKMIGPPSRQPASSYAVIAIFP